MKTLKKVFFAASCVAFMASCESQEADILSEAKIAQENSQSVNPKDKTDENKSMGTSNWSSVSPNWRSFSVNGQCSVVVDNNESNPTHFYFYDQNYNPMGYYLAPGKTCSAPMYFNKSGSWTLRVFISTAQSGGGWSNGTITVNP